MRYLAKRLTCPRESSGFKMASVAVVVAALTVMFIATKWGFFYIPHPTVVYLCVTALFCIAVFFYNILRRTSLWILALLPSVGLLYWTLHIKKLELSSLFDYAIIIYIVLTIATIINALWHKLPQKQSHMTSKKTMDYVHLTAVALLTLTFFSLGSWQISQQSLTDESYWVYERVEKYWDNIAEGDWRNTRINDKPGITVALFSGPALFEYDNTKTLKKQKLPPKERADILHAFRFPLLFAVTLFLPLFYVVLKRLTGKDEALIAYMFISLSPLLLGISRMVNPDSLLWIFLPLALLYTLLSAITKNTSRTDILLGGVFFGLALLTKYVANLLLVFIPFAIIFAQIFLQNAKNIHRNLRRGFIVYAVITLIGVLVFIVLFPGTWVKPDRILLGTIWSQAFTTPIWQLFLIALAMLYYDIFVHKNTTLVRIVQYLQRHTQTLSNLVIYGTLTIIIFIVIDVWNTHIVPYTQIIASPKSAIRVYGALEAFLADYYTLIFGLTPLALLGFILALLFFQKPRARTSSSRQITEILIVLFVLTYYVGALAGGVVTTVRYQIIMYPLVMAVASIGIARFLPQSQYLKTIVLAFIFAVSSMSLLGVQPYYFSYANALLPKNNSLNLKDMGDGSYQIALYLNALPAAKNIHVWSDKNGVCVFFVGHCSNNKNVLRDFVAHKTGNIDYFVLSSGRQIRTIHIGGSGVAPTLRVLYALPAEKTVKTIYPGNREANFVKVIKTRQ